MASRQSEKKCRKRTSGSLTQRKHPFQDDIKMHGLLAERIIAFPRRKSGIGTQRTHTFQSDRKTVGKLAKRKAECLQRQILFFVTENRRKMLTQKQLGGRAKT